MATWSWRSSWQETGRGGLAMALRAKGAGGDGHSVMAREEGEAGVEDVREQGMVMAPGAPTAAPVVEQ